MTPDPRVDRAKAGDSAALAALLAEARPRAILLAKRVLHSRDDAEDAVQDAFIKVHRHIARFEGRAQFFSWVYRIVMNTCVDRLRERVESDAPVPTEEAHEDTPEALLHRAQTGQQMRREIAALAPGHRDVIMLRELEELSYAEIAERLRCPIGTVMSRLHHARARLTEALRS